LITNGSKRVKREKEEEKDEKNLSGIWDYYFDAVYGLLCSKVYDTAGAQG
jgi:hypothetical protein